jgi:hypothetical protein
MAYNDPYAARYDPYGQPQYAEGPTYDPYNPQQPHKTYEPEPYDHEPEHDTYPAAGRYRDDPTPPEVPSKRGSGEKEVDNIATKEARTGSALEGDDFPRSKRER